MSVSDVFKNFKQIEISKNCYLHPNIPAKKLQNCLESYCFSGVQVDFLLDDTVWGSAKDRMAISNGLLYYKQIGEGPKSLNLSTVNKFTYEKRMLGNIELFIDDMPLLTVTGFDKAYHQILVDMLNACVDEAQRLSAEQAEPKSQPKAKKEPVKAPQSEVDTLQCPECDAQLPIDAKFCHECGLQIPQKDICGQCQSKLPAKARFCPKCGESADVKQTQLKPVVDPVSLRADLTQWLSDAEQEAWIDSDGDMSLRIRRSKPNFASDYRAWCSKHDITIISDSERQEQTDSACFNGDDEFSISSPYCRVGRLPSAQYEASVNASFFVLKTVEVHEIEMKEGALKIPKLGSNKISISSLSARKDNDGSYGLEYELSAYPGHVVNFEFSSDRPDADANVWGRYEEEHTQTSTSWLWDVKPGQKIYLTFGEFEPFVDGIIATFSGDAKPSEGAYDNDEARDESGEVDSAWTDDVPSSGNDDVDTILKAASDRMVELDWFEDSITNGGQVDKLMLFLTGEPDEFSVGLRLALTDRQDELDENELQEIQSAVDTYFDLNDIKTKLMSEGYDWSNLAGIECEATLMGNSSRRGLSRNMYGDGESVTAFFEWHMFRGSVNIDDMEDEDERDAAKRAVVLVEEGEQEAALQALPALWFEYNMDNLDSSPDEFMPSDQQVYFEVNYANPDHDIVLDYDDDTLILTATIRFPMQINPGVDEDEINDWLSENGGYAAGFISANWSYNGDEGGHFVFLREEDTDADDDKYGGDDDASELMQTVKRQLAGASGVTIFISEDTDSDLVDSLICKLEGDGALLVQVEMGASYMDYIAPLMEAEEGRTAILDGVQHIEEELISDFLRIVSDRVLVGTIGEGDGAKSFEMPMSAFNLVLIDRGGGETSLIRDAAKRTIAPQKDPQVRLPRENYYVSYLQAAQISDDLSSYASDGDALIGFCYSDEGIFVDKDGNIFGEDGTRSIDLVFAISDEVYAYSGYLYNSEKSEFVSGFHEGDEAHEDGRAQLVDKISSHINMSDDAISDMLYAVSCNQDDDFSEMFDDAKDTDWKYTFGSGDVISCDADEAQGRVFVELYPPVLLSASQSETGVIEFDEDAHVEGRNEELRFVGICLE